MAANGKRGSIARISDVLVTDASLVVSLEDGRLLAVPLEWFPRLRAAAEDERQGWTLIGPGMGIRWEALDQDVSLKALLHAGF